MTPDNRAGQGLVKGDVTPAILFGHVGRRSAADPGEDRPRPRFPSWRCTRGVGTTEPSDPDSPCRPNLIARPRSTLLHIRLLPAFPRTIIWILRPGSARTPRFPLNDKAAVCNHSPGAGYWFHARELCTQCRNWFCAIFRRCIDAISTARSSRLDRSKIRSLMTAWSIDGL